MSLFNSDDSSKNNEALDRMIIDEALNMGLIDRNGLKIFSPLQ